jgi:hypothetical protein
MDVRWLEGEVFQRVWEPVPGGLVFAFQFDRAGAVMTCPWRLVQDGRILLARADHGQPTEGSALIDVASAADRLLAGRSVTGGRIDSLVGDFVLEFEGGLRLEVFNDSTTNESWKMSGPDGSSLVASRGGGVISRS